MQNHWRNLRPVPRRTPFLERSRDLGEDPRDPLQAEKSVAWGHQQSFALRAQGFFTSDLTAISFDFAPTLCHRKSLLARSHLSKKILINVELLLQRTVIAPLPLETYSCTKIRTPVPLNRSTSYRTPSILQTTLQDEGYV